MFFLFFFALLFSFFENVNVDIDPYIMLFSYKQVLTMSVGYGDMCWKQEGHKALNSYLSKQAKSLFHHLNISDSLKLSKYEKNWLS